jgi:hypothetical protein
MLREEEILEMLLYIEFGNIFCPLDSRQSLGGNAGILL